VNRRCPQGRGYCLRGWRRKGDDCGGKGVIVEGKLISLHKKDLGQVKERAKDAVKAGVKYRANDRA